jgi:nicotinamide-nucleotide amidase
MPVWTDGIVRARTASSGLDSGAMVSHHDAPTAELLSIGSELLLGETVDTNAAHIGGELSRQGFVVRGVRELPDERSVIADAFNQARSRSELVVATGGLGPTHDDLTREGLADALGEELSESPALADRLRERFQAFGRMPQINLRQATLIRSAMPLENPIGSAPGWWVDRDGSVVVLLPGVPSEMRRMLAEEVVPRLARRFPLRPLHQRVVKTFGVGESAVAERLATLLSSPGRGVEAGIYARDDGVHVRFSTRGDPLSLAPAAGSALELLGTDAYGTDGETLPGAALAALGRHGAQTLASWEADTQGALLAILAATPASDRTARFVGGVLDVDSASGPPLADAVLQLSLLPQDEHGRSRVRVALSGAVTVPTTELRIHGSGPQRLRRAAYAALDQVRRALSTSDR